MRLFKQPPRDSPAQIQGLVEEAKTIAKTDCEAPRPKAPDNGTFVHQIAWLNAVDALELILPKNPNLFVVNKKGATPYDVAVTRNNKEIAEKLAQAMKASATAQIMWSMANQGKWDVFLICFSAESHLASRNPNNKWSFLHQAASQGQLRAVKFLLDQGADAMEPISPNDGRIALDLVKDSKSECALYLARFPANFPTVVPEYARTPVQLTDKFPKAQVSCVKREASMMGCRLWELSRFLSDEQADYLVNIAEDVGVKGIEWEYDASYRSCDRAIWECPELAQMMWSRLKSVFTPSDFADLRPLGFGNQGTWVPYRINPYMRVVRYREGHGFDMHMDGGFVKNEDTRSVLSLLVYLNDVPVEAAGRTMFQGKNGNGNGNNSHLEVAPQKGWSLVFNHDLFHGGEKLKGTGDPKLKKWVLRTDIMFIRIDTMAIDALGYRSDPEYMEAERLYAESIRFQKAGKPKESTTSFVRALAIQAKKPSVGVKYTPIPTVPARMGAMLDLVLPWVEIPALGRVSCVCRGWRKLCIGHRAWAVQAGVNAENRRAWGLPLEVDDFLLPMQAAREYVRRSDLVAVEIGSVYTKTATFSKKIPDVKYRTMVQNWSIQRDGRDQDEVIEYFQDMARFPDTFTDPRIIPSTTVCLEGHYWSAGQSAEERLVGNEVLKEVASGKRFRLRGHPLGLRTHTDDYFTETTVGVLVDYVGRLYKEMMGKSLQALRLAVIVPPAAVDAQNIRAVKFELNWCRGITWVSAAVAACSACKVRSGVVVLAGRDHTYIVVVQDLVEQDKSAVHFLSEEFPTSRSQLLDKVPGLKSDYNGDGSHRKKNRIEFVVSGGRTRERADFIQECFPKTTIHTPQDPFLAVVKAGLLIGAQHKSNHFGLPGKSNK